MKTLQKLITLLEDKGRLDLHNECGNGHIFDRNYEKFLEQDFNVEKWIEQNTQPLYTEQDMRAAFKAGGAVGNFHSEKRRYFDTFEQFLDSYTKPKNITT